MITTIALIPGGFLSALAGASVSNNSDVEIIRV
jgi:hypothetical protein